MKFATLLILSLVLSAGITFGSSAYANTCESVFSGGQAKANLLADIRSWKPMKVKGREDYPVVIPESSQTRKSFEQMYSHLKNLRRTNIVKELMVDESFKEIYQQTEQSLIALIGAPVMDAKTTIQAVSAFKELASLPQTSKEAYGSTRADQLRNMIESLKEEIDSSVENDFTFYAHGHSAQEASSSIGYKLPFIFVYDRFLKYRELVMSRTAGVFAISVTGRNHLKVDAETDQPAGYVPLHDIGHYSRTLAADHRLLFGKTQSYESFREEGIAALEKLYTALDKENEVLQKSVEMMLFQLTFNRSYGVLSVHKDLKNNLGSTQFDIKNLAAEVREGQHGKKVKGLLGPSQEQVTQNLERGVQWLKAYYSTP